MTMCMFNKLCVFDMCLENLQPVRTGKKKSVFDHHRMNQHKSVPVPFDLVNSPPPTKYGAEELKSGMCCISAFVFDSFYNGLGDIQNV